MSYNTRELTLDCLRSVYAQTHDVSFEVLVVDNASADGSAQAIAAEFPCIRLFLLHDNRGFAAANNLAGQHATGEWLLLLNPDTVILDRAIDKLLASAKEHSAIRPQYGIFGGRTLFPDGRLNPTSAWRRPTVWSLLSTASGLSASFRRTAFFNGEAMGGWPCDCVRAVDIVTGCFLLLRRALWERLGGFDLAFFMYGEDADLCLRARRLGVGCLICRRDDRAPAARRKRSAQTRLCASSGQGPAFRAPLVAVCFGVGPVHSRPVGAHACGGFWRGAFFATTVPRAVPYLADGLGEPRSMASLERGLLSRICGWLLTLPSIPASVS